MIARLGSDALVYAATTVLARGTAFLLVPVVTRYLSPQEIGIVELATVAITFAQVVISMEIGQALARYVPDEEYRSSTSAIASTALWFSLACYVLASCLALPLIASLVPPGSTQAAAVVIVATATGGIFLLVQGQLRWQLRPGPYAVSSLVYAGVTFVTTMALVTASGAVAAVFAGQIAGAVTGIAIVIAMSRPTFALRFETRWLRTLLTFSLPLVPASLGILTALYVDRIVIGVLLDLDDVAWFSIGHRLASTVGLVMTAVQLALTPLIYAAYRRSDAPEEIAEIFRVVVGLVLVLWLVVSLLAPELVSILASDVYLPAATVVPWQMPAIILAGMVVFAPGLWIERRTGTIAVISLGGAAANLILSVLLIGPFGIVGAAVATLMSSALVFGVMLYSSQRLYPIPYPLARSLVGAATVVGAIVISGVSVAQPLDLPVRVAVGTGTLIALAILRVVEPSRWRSSMRVAR